LNAEGGEDYQTKDGQAGDTKEADVMLQNTILTYSEEAERRGKEEIARKLLLRGDYSPEVISEIAELPVDRIKALVN
jgi:hypothetical protein